MKPENPTGVLLYMTHKTLEDCCIKMSEVKNILIIVAMYFYMSSSQNVLEIVLILLIKGTVSRDFRPFFWL